MPNPSDFTNQDHDKHDVGFHSVVFGSYMDEGKKNTWDEWQLIPSSRPNFNPPSVKTQFEELDGMNGQLDFTESVTGYPLYSNRTGEMEFYLSQDKDEKRWITIESQIMEFLHGQRLSAYLRDEPEYYYTGRWWVKQFTSEENFSTITLEYSVNPYKQDLISTGEGDKWLFDTFNFDTGVIRAYNNIHVPGKLILTFTDLGSMPIVPTFTVHWMHTGHELSLSTAGHSYQLKLGENLITDIEVVKGAASFTFTGHGVITVTMRGGRL